MPSDASAAMKLIGEVDGCKVYWAEPGLFKRPGVWYWNGKENVYVPVIAEKVEPEPIEIDQLWCHADGDIYVVVTLGKMKHPDTGEWLPAIGYRKARFVTRVRYVQDGEVFTTTEARWRDRFTKMNDPGLTS